MSSSSYFITLKCLVVHNDSFYYQVSVLYNKSDYSLTLVTADRSTSPLSPHKHCPPSLFTWRFAVMAVKNYYRVHI